VLNRKDCVAHSSRSSGNKTKMVKVRHGLQWQWLRGIWTLHFDVDVYCKWRSLDHYLRDLTFQKRKNNNKLKCVKEGECKRQEYSPDIRRRYERCNVLHNHQLVSVLLQLCQRNSRELFVKTWIKDTLWCNLIVVNFK